MEETASSIMMATARDLADLEHHEVVDGVVVRKASPTYSHGMIQSIITAQLYMGGAYARRGGGWWLSSEAEVELAAHQVYLPDVAGWRVETMPEEPEPTEHPIHVRPDWVCEILSPSTARFDMGTKRAHYCAAGVGHYWIVDPFHSTLTILRNTGRTYEVVTVATADDVEVALEPFAEITFDLKVMLGQQKSTR